MTMETLSPKKIEDTKSSNGSMIDLSEIPVTKGNFTLCAKSTTNWPTANIASISLHVAKALRAQKYLLIWDRIGSTTTFFSSMEKMVDLEKLLDKVKTKKMDRQ
jgi:hypothetical protein